MTEMDKPAQQKKDKKAVEGEVFDDARIRGFLAVQPPAGVDADFHALEIAYRGMKAEDFARFVAFFRENGRNVNARDPQGRTFAEQLTRHRNGNEYLAALQA